MANFRCTLTNPNNPNIKNKTIDLTATDSDEAFKKAYKLADPYRDYYTDMSVEKVPDGPKIIGIQFHYYDTYSKKTFTDCLMIRANNEAQAADYYNRHYKDQHFWFSAGEIDPKGKHIYKDIIETYYAACPGYHADATKAAS